MYYLVLARACDSLPDGNSSEIRLGFKEKPSAVDVAAARQMAIDAFKGGFGRAPARTGQAILPWSDSIDRPDDEDVAVGQGS